MTLGQKQRLFTGLVSNLIEFTYYSGFELTFGEAWRPPETAKIYAQEGRGIPTSLHLDRLGIDLNLFKDGEWLTDTEDHRPLGEFWERQHELCVWGGRFKKPDGNHYAITHGGRK